MSGPLSLVHTLTLKSLAIVLLRILALSSPVLEQRLLCLSGSLAASKRSLSRLSRSPRSLKSFKSFRNQVLKPSGLYHVSQGHQGPSSRSSPSEIKFSSPQVFQSQAKPFKSTSPNLLSILFKQKPLKFVHPRLHHLSPRRSP